LSNLTDIHPTNSLYLPDELGLDINNIEAKIKFVTSSSHETNANSTHILHHNQSCAARDSVEDIFEGLMIFRHGYKKRGASPDDRST
jgi:hypothetical protein